ncbi:MAG TPA: DNA polymerase I [Verrucomicrobiae bacterium]|nr:DNA polymerase I [Verrucomicrobiae bacterium]
MTEFKQKLLMIDGHALTFRAFHALPNLTNSEGFPTGAIFGFFSMFLKSLEDIKPTYALVTFDLAGPTFRHKMSGDYKANRKPTPSEIDLQVPKITEILNAMNIPVFQKPGYEADDLLGIISRKVPEKVLNIIATGDKDLYQLINKNTVIYRFKGFGGFSEVDLYDEKKFEAEYGIKPTQWVDYKGLRGDPSDNIPGVKGIGEKTGLELIQQFGSIEKLYEIIEKNPAKVKPAVLKKLIEGKPYAELSKRLAFIDTKNGLEFDFEKTKLADYDQEQVLKYFQQFAIKSLIPKLPKISVKAEKVLEAKSVDRDFTIIDTTKKLNDLIIILQKQKTIAIDTEKTIGPLVDSQLVGFSLSFKPNQAYYIPTFQHPELDAFSALKPILENIKIEKVGHDLKTDSLLLKKYGVNLFPLNFDTEIAAYLINPGQRNYQIESLGFTELGLRKKAIEGYEEKPRERIPFEQIKLVEAAHYSCEDVDVTFKLKSKLDQQLRELKLTKLFEDIEMPLVPVLMRMESLGITLDKGWLKKLSKEAETEIKSLEKKIHKLAGREFNISSPIQLREILFDELKIPTTEIRKRGKTGAISTAATELEKLRGLHPIVDHIFDYRELSKLKSTYLDSLPELVSKVDNRVHTSYSQTVAATGRLSSSDPNLQNIPVRTELGRQVRKAFVAEEGFVLASLDYSQIELRIAASLSGDPEMTKIFKSGKDFHSATAARIFNVMESAVTFEQRRDAKTINFSVLYGVSAFGLSERTDMGRSEAGDFIKRYYQVFGKLKKYIDDRIKEVHDKGYALNPLGRLRQFPDINSSNFAVRSAAERAAFNMPVQSLAADIIKMAMIEIDKKLLDENCRMLLQVHDELVFEIKKGLEQECIPKIKKIMESVYGLKVPLEVDAKVGQNWLEMKKI